MNETDRNLLIISVVAVLILSVSYLNFSPVGLSGYQSVVAEWHSVTWDTYTDTGGTVWPAYEEDLSGTSMVFDGNDRFGSGIGISDWCRYSGNIDQPKFDHNLEYHDWWINDTVTAENPTGEAKHYEYSIDQYRMMITLISHGVYGTQICDGVKFWFEIYNNAESVFENLGAEEAASFIVHAYVGNYTWIPETVNHHIVNPNQGSFDLTYVNSSTVAPDALEEGSGLDFDQLEKYSHIKSEIEVVDFGTEIFGTDVTINLEVYLNVLTVGRFDHVLTYEAGGENSDAPIGNSGIFDSIAAALDAGYSALMDEASDLLNEAWLPIMMIVVGIFAVLIIIIVIKSAIIPRFRGRNK